MTVSWVKTGEIAHVSSPSNGIAQKVILARHTADATCKLGMGCCKTLSIAALSLIYSTAEYCAPIWCRSAHTCLIDSVLNQALRIFTGCLRPTTTNHLPILSDIQPAELRRLGATLSLTYRRYLNLDHIFYGLLSGSSDARQERLRSRRSFVPTARNLLDNLAGLGIRASEGTNHKWKTEYCENSSRLHVLCPGPVPDLLR